MDAKQARNKALELLTYREHTRRELHAKLLKRDCETDLASETIALLTQENLQSDERFAEIFVQQRIDKGFGERKICAELRSRGIESDLAEHAMVEADVDWIKRAYQVAERKLKYPDQQINKSQEFKCMRFLSGRGFSHEQINKAISLLKSNEV